MAFFRNYGIQYEPRPIPVDPPYDPPIPPTPDTPQEGSIPDIPRPLISSDSTITFYKSYDDKNVVSKSLSGDVSISGGLVEDTDILHPVITVEATQQFNPLEFNYAYIDTTDRYYYMRPIILPEDHYRLIFDVDPLKSWDVGIKNLVGIVSRTEDERYVNPDLDDGSIVNQEGIAIKIDMFDYGFLDVPVEILVVAGGGY